MAYQCDKCITIIKDVNYRQYYGWRKSRYMQTLFFIPFVYNPKTAQNIVYEFKKKGMEQTSIGISCSAFFSIPVLSRVWNFKVSKDFVSDLLSFLASPKTWRATSYFPFLDFRNLPYVIFSSLLGRYLPLSFHTRRWNYKARVKGVILSISRMQREVYQIFYSLLT